MALNSEYIGPFIVKLLPNGKIGIWEQKTSFTSYCVAEMDMKNFEAHDSDPEAYAQQMCELLNDALGWVFNSERERYIPKELQMYMDEANNG